MYFVYFLRSESDPEKTYIGYTANLAKRLFAHNNGKTRKAHTWKFRPWKLEAFVLADTMETAKKVESYFKNTSGKEKFQKFAAANPGHPNAIEGFFDSQKEERKFGNSVFKIKKNSVLVMTNCDTEAA